MTQRKTQFNANANTGRPYWKGLKVKFYIKGLQ